LRMSAWDKQDQNISVLCRIKHGTTTKGGSRGILSVLRLSLLRVGHDATN